MDIVSHRDGRRAPTIEPLASNFNNAAKFDAARAHGKSSGGLTLAELKQWAREQVAEAKRRRAEIDREVVSPRSTAAYSRAKSHAGERRPYAARYRSADSRTRESIARILAIAGTRPGTKMLGNVTSIQVGPRRYAFRWDLARGRWQEVEA